MEKGRDALVQLKLHWPSETPFCFERLLWEGRHSLQEEEEERQAWEREVEEVAEGRQLSGEMQLISRRSRTLEDGRTGEREDTVQRPEMAG